jgi:isocitrate dehydrogenase
MRLPADRPHLCRPAGIEVVKTSDISVAAASWASSPNYLTDAQKVPDNLAELGRLTLLPDTNIIKLPNISASVPSWSSRDQGAAGQGLQHARLPREPQDRRRKGDPRALRQMPGQRGEPGAARRQLRPPCAAAVKEYARKHPHSMGEWSQASRTHVAHMKHGDFYHGEKSMTLDKAATCDGTGDRSGKTQVLKPGVAAGRRDHRQHVHEQEGAVRVLRAQIEDAARPA